MGFRSRIFSTSKGSTIDAVGDGCYLVCNKATCITVKGLHSAHTALKKQDGLTS